MRALWPWRRRPSVPSEDARTAVQQAGRALQDADRLAEHISEVASRAHRVADRADEVRRVNHIAEAVMESMRRVQHP